MSIAQKGDIVNALQHVPREHRRVAAGLIGRVIESGADPFSAIAAAYRWTGERREYGDIHRGLDEFFQGVIHREVF
ncbi:MAG: hypothetical protein BWY65_01699 [Firmicutes bacterium ADurb.Bin373]|nr:MAG: hypothetical protein BWY65_01699 [Firmicutes bacterium ADurb.Bin373]